MPKVPKVKPPYNLKASHERWIEYAERIDSLRIFPRIFLIASFTCVMSLTWVLMWWYMGLDSKSRVLEGATSFGVFVIGIMWGFLKMIYSDYKDSGRDWNGRSSTTMTTSATTITATDPTAIAAK